MDAWKSLNLHLENLLPGIVTFVLVAHLLPPAVTSDLMKNPIFTNDIARSGAFIAVAYLLGVVVVAFCRVLDKASAWRPRRLGLRWLAIESKEIEGKDNDWVNRHYRDRVRRALLSGNTEVKAEIAKRRERLHLLRSALVPAVLGVWVLQLAWPFKLVLSIVTAVVTLALYTYLEVAIYDETDLSTEKKL
jgi:hypothetical protein